MDTELDVLQHLAMEGIAEATDVAADTDHPESAVQETLAELEADGCVENEGFWYLTDAGEKRLSEVCRARFDGDQLAELAALLDDFHALDTRMKELAEAWQGLPEDERGSDAEPVADLRGLQADLEALFDGLSPATREVYEPYLESLDDAIAALADGEADYFTGTEVDSYHTVWFELHDDLLRTLGEER
jgi:DNA-binding MarR family transcriptional regulator